MDHGLKSEADVVARSAMMCTDIPENISCPHTQVTENLKGRKDDRKMENTSITKAAIHEVSKIQPRPKKVFPGLRE